MKESQSTKGMKNFYRFPRTSLIGQYPSIGVPSEEKWRTIMAEDAMRNQMDCGHETEDASVEAIDLNEELDVDQQNDTTTHGTPCYNIA